MTEGNDQRIGPFPSWGWLYGTVLIYGLLVIIILSILSTTLSFGVGS